MNQRFPVPGVVNFLGGMLAGAEERPRLLNPHSFSHSFLSPRFFAVTFLGRVLPWRVRGVFFRVHRLAGVGRGGHLHLEQIVGFVGLCAGLGGNGIGAVAMRSIGAKIAAVCTWVDDVGNFVRWFGGGHCGRGFFDERRRASCVKNADSVSSFLM